jgi:galactokinase
LRAAALFRRCFGGEPSARASASGRVNLIGDHVDYAGGTVLPMAIAARTHVAAAVAPHDEAVSEWKGDGLWTRYAFGVLSELRACGIDVPPLALAVAGDVPVGAGLSSSAALEVAVARAALLAANATLPPREVALLCRRAEHAHAGVPCGIMDQWCVAHAERGQAIALDCAGLAARQISLPRELRIEIVDSGVRHRLHDGGYAARRADVEEAARLLGVEHLARFPASRRGELDALPPRLARRARHVVSEQSRVVMAIKALEDSDLGRFGELLVESHASLRDDFDVSVPELDRIVESAMSRGALGARMTGGGFGGCALIAWR